jgi:putative endonuclease
MRKTGKNTTPASKVKQLYFVYILETRDRRYYTGYTTDIERRFREHQDGIGGKFTRAFGAVRIVYQESYPTKSEAMKREALIKTWSREKKRRLIGKVSP